jgi:hypothetical protein
MHLVVAAVATLIWIIYRLLNIPRTINILDGIRQVFSNFITGQILAELIGIATSQTLIRAIKTNESIAQGLYNTL